MTAAQLLYGNSLNQAVEHIVGKAWDQHTAEAMREASAKLHGISIFLVCQDQAHVFSDALVRLTNERDRCERAANLIAEGKL